MKSNNILMILAIGFLALFLFRKKGTFFDPNQSPFNHMNPPQSSGVNQNMNFLGAKYNTSNPIYNIQQFGQGVASTIGLGGVAKVVQGIENGVLQKTANIFKANTWAHHLLNWFGGG